MSAEKLTHQADRETEPLGLQISTMLEQIAPADEYNPEMSSNEHRNSQAHTLYIGEGKRPERITVLAAANRWNVIHYPQGSRQGNLYWVNQSDGGVLPLSTGDIPMTLQLDTSRGNPDEVSVLLLEKLKAGSLEKPESTRRSFGAGILSRLRAIKG